MDITDKKVRPLTFRTSDESDYGGGFAPARPDIFSEVLWLVIRNFPLGAVVVAQIFSAAISIARAMVMLHVIESIEGCHIISICRVYSGRS